MSDLKITSIRVHHSEGNPSKVYVTELVPVMNTVHHQSFGDPVVQTVDVPGFESVERLCFEGKKKDALAEVEHLRAIWDSQRS